MLQNLDSDVLKNILSLSEFSTFHSKSCGFKLRFNRNQVSLPSLIGFKLNVACKQIFHFTNEINIYVSNKFKSIFALWIRVKNTCSFTFNGYSLRVSPQRAN